MTSDLAARIEAADGPSYALDCAIWDVVYPGERQARFDKLTAPGQPYHRRLGPADVDGYIKPLRAFTASIDAALMLVPEGRDWSVAMHTLSDGTRAAIARILLPNGIGLNTAAPTPALALAAAALRAKDHDRG